MAGDAVTGSHLVLVTTSGEGTLLPTRELSCTVSLALHKPRASHAHAAPPAAPPPPLKPPCGWFASDSLNTPPPPPLCVYLANDSMRDIMPGLSSGAALLILMQRPRSPMVCRRVPSPFCLQRMSTWQQPKAQCSLPTFA